MRSLLIIFLPLLAIIQGCDDGALFQDSQEISGGSWDRSEWVDFEFEMTDHEARYDMFLDVRNDNSYAYSNLYVFFHLDFPNGKQRLDTVECILADPTGKWYGSGLGDVYDNRIRIIKGFSLPMDGEYKIRIEQGMREESLEGILDVGFRLAQSQ